MKKLSTVLIVFVTCALSFAQPVITKIGTYKCGRQPKQVLFSPDSKFIVLPLLDNNGFDIFSVADKKVIQRINPPDAKKVGFAEGLFIPEKKVFLVSQMTTANVYELFLLVEYGQSLSSIVKKKICYVFQTGAAMTFL